MISARYADASRTRVIVSTGSGQPFDVPANSSNAVYSKLVADGIAISDPDPRPFDGQAVKIECGRRIYAVASAASQVNMAAARAAGIMSEAENTAFLAGLAWIAAMRAASATLISTEDATFADDVHWPACPAEVVALAANF